MISVQIDNMFDRIGSVTRRCADVGRLTQPAAIVNG